MSKLDYDLLQQAESRINPVKERELDLRGFKISRIENLILTKDQYECIDLTNNDIQVLGNFTFMPNLSTLLLSNNRIQKIEKLPLPSLKVLILQNNQLQKLGDLDNLMNLELEYLILIGNVVVHFQYYRLYLIHRIPSLKCLDYKKVTEKERKQAALLFHGSKGKQLLEKLSSCTSTAPIETTRELDVKQQEKIREQIKNATSLQEIALLEQQLASY
jgi:U2 small nuclear ribonucleoprotein A'